MTDAQQDTREEGAEQVRLAVEVWNGFHQLLALRGWSRAEISAAVLDRRLERLILDRPTRRQQMRCTGWSAAVQRLAAALRLPEATDAT